MSGMCSFSCRPTFRREWLSDRGLARGTEKTRRKRRKRNRAPAFWARAGKSLGFFHVMSPTPSTAPFFEKLSNTLVGFSRKSGAPNDEIELFYTVVGIP